jgi:hypothetical protein
MVTMQECITNCLDCHSVCLQTISHCLSKGGDHAESDHIRVLHDCTQVCITSADFMLRNSPLHPMICHICARVCEICAVDCESFADGDEQMRLCIVACRRCTESCGEMAEAERRVA